MDEGQRVSHYSASATSHVLLTVMECRQIGHCLAERYTPDQHGLTSLMLWGMANLWKEGKEPGAYAVRHESLEPVHDFGRP